MVEALSPLNPALRLGYDSPHCTSPKRSWYVFRLEMSHYFTSPLMRRSISSSSQTVVRAPNLRGAGYLPDLTPFHQLDLLIGIFSGMICFKRSNLLILQPPNNSKVATASTAASYKMPMIHVTRCCWSALPSRLLRLPASSIRTMAWSHRGTG